MHKMNGIWVFLILVSVSISSCGIKPSLNHRPDITHYNAEVPEREHINDSTFFAGDNFLTRNRHGLWELYVTGDPLERGLLTGSLSRELILQQEAAMFSKIHEMVPSATKRSLLRKFLSWFNRKMYLHVAEEYKTEIFGVSKYASSDFNELAPPYLRGLYLHGAHDIGHALRDLALVGCSSFAVWGDKSADGKLLIARNFDFYAGDAFARNKIIAFVNPSEGYNFMSVTWGGMMGVVSGMNDQGLTVTINAGKSRIPLVAKTPVSLITREILQYASTIEEAIAIAKKREVFVSEAILIGSARDGRAAIIEISPFNMGVYEVPGNEQLVCANHFQSEAFSEDKRNLKQIEESHSQYRFERMEELLAADSTIGAEDAVDILRNKEGLNGAVLGFGNEKALNQLLAHHGIVFKPETLQVWVSSNPYQLGAFVAYDLNEVFKGREGNPSEVSLAIPQLTIAEDPFLNSEAFRDYEQYRVLEQNVEDAIEAGAPIPPETLSELQQKNPDYWKAYALAGNYYYKNHYYAAALHAFQNASRLEITTLPAREWIEKLIEKLKRKCR